MEKLFDGCTITKAGAEVPASTLATTEVVGLYFSAHWCPPCKMFTPKLAETYKQVVAAGKSFEIVFVSSDRDEKSFAEYAAEQPWAHLAFKDREAKARLSKKYKVSGIPSLVLLDGKTGKVITMDGRSALSNDPKGAKFPWIPPTIAEAIGSKLVKNDGTEVDASAALKGKTYGVYFSAHWCPPCKGFTPKLAEAYNKLKARGDDFEVVFVSGDKNEKAFGEYFATMPWLALPFDDRDREQELSALFEVEGIPTLCIIGPDGKLANPDGVQSVSGDPECAKFPWGKEAVTALEDAGGFLNSSPCVILFGGDQGALAAPAKEEIARVAAAGDDDEVDEVRFVGGGAEGGHIADQIKKVCELGDAGGGAQLILLDIPDQGGYYVHEGGEVTEAAVRQFVSDYRAKKLTRKQMS
jgi:nucleoredoxin